MEVCVRIAADADGVLKGLPRPTYPNFGFDVLHQDPTSPARLGLLRTPHGNVETPNFIFCGTKANVKGITPQQLREAGTQIILSNTYHLYIQPGKYYKYIPPTTRLMRE